MVILSKASTPAHIAICTALLCACGGDQASTPTQDAGATPDPIGAPVALIVEPLGDEAPERAFVIEGGDVLAVYSDRLERIRTATVTRYPAPAGGVTGLGTWSGGVLLAGSGGFYVLGEDGLTRSPLSDELLDYRPEQLLSVDRAGTRELWFVGPSGLSVWADGTLSNLSLGASPFGSCRLAFGAPFGGARAVWVACSGTLFALIGAGSRFEAYPQPDVSDARSLAVDQTGTLWIVEEDGTVRSRAPDGTLRAHDFTSRASKVLSSMRSDDVWFETDDGLWRYDQSTFSRLQTQGRVLAAEVSGQVVLSTLEGLMRGHTERVVRFAGLDDRGLLPARTTVTLHPVDPDAVRSIAATLDDAPLEVQSDEGWSVLVDPEGLSDGVHRLSVSVGYQDGGSAEATLQFSTYSGPPPTWSADVRPIFEAHCALCHGAQGSARRLDARTQWVEQSDLIFDNIRNGRMPLPPVAPLSAEQLGRIEGWAAAGYPEGE